VIGRAPRGVCIRRRYEPDRGAGWRSQGAFNKLSNSQIYRWRNCRRISRQILGFSPAGSNFCSKIRDLTLKQRHWPYGTVREPGAPGRSSRKIEGDADHGDLKWGRTEFILPISVVWISKPKLIANRLNFQSSVNFKFTHFFTGMIDPKCAALKFSQKPIVWRCWWIEIFCNCQYLADSSYVINSKILFGHDQRGLDQGIAGNPDWVIQCLNNQNLRRSDLDWSLLSGQWDHFKEADV
jgi:hypothetical protein